MPMSSPKTMRPVRRFLAAASLSLAVSQVCASGLLSDDAVGEVTLVLGKAWVEHPGANRERLRGGMQIRVNDVIKTESSSTVHVRFVDNALVAVRQDSRLGIQSYTYDAARPENSSVKFELEEGVTRAISGEAAKKARENFRMNTPIAAIGVRGTDFVVTASEDSVRAFVNEGTIVVAPFSTECSAASFGPCQNNALELSGGGNNQIVEVRADALTPVFLPADALQPAVPAAEPQAQVAAAPAPKKEAEEGAADPYVTSVTTRAVTQSLQDAPPPVQPTPAPPPPPPPAPIVVAPQVPETPVVPPPPAEPPPVAIVADVTPPAPIPTETLKNSQLIWGRWAESDLSYERITVTYGVASADRKVGVQNDRYVMFRTQNGPNVVQRGLGTVDFTLNQAQATLTQNGSRSLMAVEGGMLQIDFDNERFSTSLDLHHEATGDLRFSDAGSIYSGGYFHSRNPGQTMAGAVSLDGAEAGYVFDKTLPNGSIEGLTLWGRQP